MTTLNINENPALRQRMAISSAVIDGKAEQIIFAPEDDFMDAPTRRYMLVREIDERLPGSVSDWLEDEGEAIPAGKRVKTVFEMSAAERDCVFVWFDAPDAESVDKRFLFGLLVDAEAPAISEAERIAVPGEIVALAVNVLDDASDAMEDLFDDPPQGPVRKQRLDVALGGLQAALRGSNAVAPALSFVWGVTVDEVERAAIELGCGDIDPDVVTEAVAEELRDINEIVSAAVKRGVATAVRESE